MRLVISRIRTIVTITVWIILALSLPPNAAQARRCNKQLPLSILQHRSLTYIITGYAEKLLKKENKP